MFFSVIIPTCNRNDLLSNCLNLIAPSNQITDSFEYEVIVTDDSKDNLAKNLIDSKYKWVKWVEGPKRGPAANRNNGAKNAIGEWLVFIDDDCLPDVEILKNYRYLIINNHDVEIFEGKIDQERDSKSPLEYSPINLKGGFLWSCNFAIHKNTFFHIKGFDENFIYPHLEDVDLRKRLVDYNYKIIFAESAAVVHPWRKMTNGIKLGMYQEMSLYYNAKHHINKSLIQLLIQIFRVHMGLLKKSRLSNDFFLSLKITYEHLITVIINYNKWKKKYV